MILKTIVFWKDSLYLSWKLKIVLTVVRVMFKMCWVNNYLIFSHTSEIWSMETFFLIDLNNSALSKTQLF